MKIARTVDRLTRHEAELVLEVLSAHFGVLLPTLAWSDRARRGRASRTRWLISAGACVWRGTTNCLLHEFAHILVFSRFPHLRVKPHGRQFLEALREVTAYWPHDYDWQSEYRQIAVAGPRDSVKR